MMSTSNYILSDIIDIVRIRIRIRSKIKDKYNIGDIRPYPIRFHPIFRSSNRTQQLYYSKNNSYS